MRQQQQQQQQQQLYIYIYIYIYIYTNTAQSSVPFLLHSFPFSLLFILTARGAHGLARVIHARRFIRRASPGMDPWKFEWQSARSARVPISGPSHPKGVQPKCEQKGDPIWVAGS